MKWGAGVPALRDGDAALDQFRLTWSYKSKALALSAHSKNCRG